MIPNTVDAVMIIIFPYSLSIFFIVTMNESKCFDAYIENPLLINLAIDSKKINHTLTQLPAFGKSPPLGTSQRKI